MQSTGIHADTGQPVAALEPRLDANRENYNFIYYSLRCNSTNDWPWIYKAESVSCSIRIDLPTWALFYRYVTWKVIRG